MGKMRNKIKKLEILTEKNLYPKTTRFFLYSLYGWIILNTLMLLPRHGFFWGPETLIPKTARLGGHTTCVSPSFYVLIKNGTLKGPTKVFQKA